MKILIISHNPISTQSNMGKTMLSLFSGCGREELCQLYIYPTLPDLDRCASYYRITDKDILRSLVTWKKPGREIEKECIGPGQGLYERAEDQALYKNRKNKSAVRRLLRDAMWAMVRWYHKDLQAWLERENPECIFVAPGAAKFLYNLALRISVRRQIPVVSYICDEYYFVREPDAWLDKIRLKLLKRKIRQLMKASSRIVVISEELKQIYSQEFGAKVQVLMTGASGAVSEKIHIPQEPQIIGYFGNIRCNRFVSLGEVGRSLDSINDRSGKEYRLKIYTAEKDPKILDTFTGIRSIELCGFVSGEAYDTAMRSVDLLLHVEAFDEASMDFTQHSVSTKIADSLASGIPLLAYAPEELSSTKHLVRNSCAILATSRDTLEAVLLEALENRELRSKTAYNALAAAARYHDREKAGAKLRQILEEICHENIAGQ